MWVLVIHVLVIYDLSYTRINCTIFNNTCISYIKFSNACNNYVNISYVEIAIVRQFLFLNFKSYL